MKICKIRLDDKTYDYLKKRAKEINERMGGAEIITAEDMAAGILAAKRDQEEKEEIK